jgi:chromosome partitioning protein
MSQPATHPSAADTADRPRTLPRIIALINQKGGVGKTTTTVNLGAALARLNHRVLYIDLDPQAHLTLHVGVDADQLERSVYDLLVDRDITAEQVVVDCGSHMQLLPAEVNLAGAETELAALAEQGRAQRLLADKVLPLIQQRQYHYVLIDCPPSLGLLTINALALAREVLVPMQAHFLALQGLSKLLETVALVRRSLNPDLTVTGVAPCMHEGNTILANEVIADLKTFFDAARSMDVPWSRARVLDPAIRRNIKLAECPSFGQTIFEYAPDCHGAKDYDALAQSLLALKAAAPSRDESADPVHHESADDAAAVTAVPANAAS